MSNVCRRQKHPELKDRTIDQVFSEEKKHLLALPASPFDGYQGTTARVSSQLLVSFDRNRYSVNAMAAGKIVEVRAYANRIIVVMNNAVVGVHMRHLGRDRVIYDPWHYLSVLEQKPGALRNGAPFKEWNLPDSIREVRTQLAARSDGDRQFLAILSVVKRYGLDSVADACAQALTDKTISSDVILTILSRQHDEPQGSTTENYRLGWVNFGRRWWVNFQSRLTYPSPMPWDMRRSALQKLLDTYPHK